MNQTIVASPTDAVPQTRIVYPGIGTQIIFDFTQVIATGVTITSYTIGISDNSLLYLLSASSTSTTVIINLGSSLFSGQQCMLSCTIITSDSLQDGRAVVLAGYNTTAGSSAPPGDSILISSPVTMTPGLIPSDGVTVALPMSISILGAVPGNAAIVSANPSLPLHVSIVNATVPGSGIVTAEIQNLSGGPVTIGATAFTATVIQ